MVTAQGASATELSREMFHCPSWCTVDLERHKAELRSWEGGCIHWSGSVPVEGWDIDVSRTTDPIGRRTTPREILFEDDPMTVEQAEELVAALQRAIEISRSA